MALEPALKNTVRWIDKAFRDYATKEGWQPGDFRTFVRVNPNWGTVQVILAARKFSGDTPQEQWLRVMNFLDEELKARDPGLMQGVSLTIRTFDQIQDHGEFTLNPGFVEIHELLGPGTAPVRADRDTF